MRKSTVQSTVFPLAALAFMLSLLLGSSSALAACPELATTKWDLSQNFWPTNQLTMDASGTTGNIDNFTSAISSVTCTGSTITFRRSGSDFFQDYRGTIERFCATVCVPRLMHGTFTHNSTGLYGWYARIK
jgi:hypothetical protein